MKVVQLYEYITKQFMNHIPTPKNSQLVKKRRKKSKSKFGLLVKNTIVSLSFIPLFPLINPKVF